VNEFIRQVWAIAGKDLRSELRTKEGDQCFARFRPGHSAAVSFASRGQRRHEDVAGGLLWMVFAFAGTLILNRSFVREVPNDCLDAILASPISGAAYFLGKAIGNFVLLIAIEIACLPVFSVFYDVRLTAHLVLAGASSSYSRHGRSW